MTYNERWEEAFQVLIADCRYSLGEVPEDTSKLVEMPGLSKQETKLAFAVLSAVATLHARSQPDADER